MTASVELLFFTVYDIAYNGWVKGPSLPAGISGSPLIEFHNGLITVGGNWSNFKQHFYQLSNLYGVWIKMQSILKEQAVNQVGFLVPDHIINCY